MTSGPRRVCSALCVTPLLLAIGCGAQDASAGKGVAAKRGAVDVRDWVLEPLASPDPARDGPARIVSFAPSITEILYALGLDDRLVGRTRYCLHPPRAQQVPSVGALTNVSAETLVALEPDLVLVAGTSRLVADRIRALGLNWQSLPDDSLDDIFRSIQAVGTLTGRSQTAALLESQLRSDLDRVRSAYEDGPRRRVLIVLDALANPPMPPVVAGPGSFYDDLLQFAGHENVVAPLERAFGALSLEVIVSLDPDVIIEIVADGRRRSAGNADALRAWQTLGDLTAVREGRVRLLTGSAYFLPGPRIASTFDALCAAIADDS